MAYLCVCVGVLVIIMAPNSIQVHENTQPYVGTWINLVAAFSHYAVLFVFFFAELLISGTSKKIEGLADVWLVLSLGIPFVLFMFVVLVFEEPGERIKRLAEHEERAHQEDVMNYIHRRTPYYKELKGPEADPPGDGMSRARATFIRILTGIQSSLGFGPNGTFEWVVFFLGLRERPLDCWVVSVPRISDE